MRNLLNFDSFVNESAETGSYEAPNSPVKIPAGDKGFKTVQKHYNRFMWTLNDMKKKKKSKLNKASIQKQ
jgi:hypothetical protein